ncbi:ATP-binding protein [Zoogloea sp.]|uniref:sensor histidine kinase n=1 Tax=Zoogloea sp. TaxID=49181 RepID=UPI002637F6CE|nr:ATP-binding protein [Zoogloea sp.]MDD3354459.1 hypothetical protein [Zoogloea sp.]
MELSRLLVRRMALLLAACFLLWWALAAIETRRDLRREGQGAEEIARLVGELANLHGLPADRLEAQLSALREIHRSGSLQHLDFQVEVDQGRVLIPARIHSWPKDRELGRLHFQGQDGRRFEVSLLADPVGAREDARSDLAGALLAFLVLACAVLAGVHRISRQALDQADGQARRQSLQWQAREEARRMRIEVRLQEQLAQDVTALRAQLALLSRHMADKADPVQTALKEARSQCGRIQQGVTALLKDVRDPVCGEGREALAPLLHDVIESWQDRQGAPIHWALDVQPLNLSLPRETALMLYRMTQEACSNIVRHSAPRRARVAVRQAPDTAWVEWTVEDDGVGMEAIDEAIGRGTGLAALREGIWARGGELNIRPGEMQGGSAGLRLEARLPVTPVREEWS